METRELRNKLTGRTKEEMLLKRNIEDFNKYVRRYGEYVEDWEWETEQGCYRESIIYINGMYANIMMLNGSIIEAGISIKDK